MEQPAKKMNPIKKINRLTHQKVVPGETVQDRIFGSHTMDREDGAARRNGLGNGLQQRLQSDWFL